MFPMRQTAFRGGNGQVAIGMDQEGRILGASTMTIDTPQSEDWPNEVVTVCRFDPQQPLNVEWSVAGYTFDGATSFLGKPILDGPGVNVIARMVPLFMLGGTKTGRSISAPMVDSVGNIWFMAVIEYVDPGSDLYDKTIIRAVYNPAIFGYELELVLAQDWEFMGCNSQTKYQIGYMEIADAGLDPSISSGTMFSGNINQCAFNNINPSDQPTSSPFTLGGIVFQCSITYDSNDNGEFDQGGAPGYDEEYKCLMYIGAPDPYTGAEPQGPLGPMEPVPVPPLRGGKP